MPGLSVSGAQNREDMPECCRVHNGRSGRRGSRTPDIILVKDALYQLSYAPSIEQSIVPAARCRELGEKFWGGRGDWRATSAVIDHGQLASV